MFMNTPLSPVSGRLASLDILRGFDLFLLVFFQPVFVALGQRLNFPWLNDILYQFDHESWIGFRFWDLVMPLFLFMTGASMPFSFSKFKNAPNKWPVYRKIIKRFVLLFIFGMIVQGNLLGLNPDSLYLYSNTLQAIATGLSYCSNNFVTLFFPLSGAHYIIIVTALLDTDDFLRRFYSRREFCRKGRPTSARPVSGWCVLGRRWKLAFFSLLYLYLDME